MVFTITPPFRGIDAARKVYAGSATTPNLAVQPAQSRFARRVG